MVVFFPEAIPSVAPADTDRVLFGPQEPELLVEDVRKFFRDLRNPNSAKE